MTAKSTIPRHDPDPNSLPAGFRFAGVACGIKASGRLDVSLVVCDRPSTVAGVYTQSQVVAAPVVLCRDRTPRPTLRAVVTNSGNANACTGDEGMVNARAMSDQVAALLDCPTEDVLVMSTGVIGQQLPMNHINAGIIAAENALGTDVSDFVASADGICTTDQYRKIAFTELEFAGRVYRIAAMAKGAGMIAPNMATMLAMVLTDAPLSTDVANEVLTRAADQSFNRISVDGHTSTNDTMLLLATGQGDSLAGDDLHRFQAAVNELSIELAKMIVADGEGATHVMSIQVRGAETDGAALEIARTIGASPLVKTAITGGDPNWGRIVSSAGYANAVIQPERTSLKICGQTIYSDGAPVAFDAAALSRTMKGAPDVLIELTVGDGAGASDFWASDLTTEYVRFNSEYTT